MNKSTARILTIPVLVLAAAGLLWVSLTLQESNAAPARSDCQAYIQLVCSNCGAESQICKTISQKFNACDQSPTCRADLCAGAYADARRIPVSGMRSLLCPSTDTTPESEPGADPDASY